MIKICSSCKEELDTNFFSKDKYHKDGLTTSCKNCQKIFYEKNKNKIRKRHREYAKKNSEKNSERGRKWVEEHRKQAREYKRKYERKRRQEDIKYKLLSNLSRRVRSAINNNSKSKNTINLVGCSIEELKQHLEKQFKEGMSWENYGLYGWHIDHIAPCYSFNLLLEEEQKKCFHYTNMQPLWAKENLKKGKKYVL